MLVALLQKAELSSAEQQKVMINEVCSLNFRTIRDGVNDCSDYIELYNSSNEMISLEGWYISDDELNLTEYALPAYDIYPHGYLVLYANGTEGDFSLPFKINDAGEKLFLSDNEEKLIDSVAIPRLDIDVSYARIEDRASQWEMKEPTPNEANEAGQRITQATLEAPKFSQKSGFYDEEFYLTLSAKEGETIYYTLDGSIPNEEAYVYEEPLLIQETTNISNQYVSQQRVVKLWKEYTPDTKPVDKAVVVRAVAVNEEGRVSDIATETYFVNLNEYRDMPVISLTIEPDELFGEAGIFVTGKAYDEWYEGGMQGEAPVMNFFQRGKSWEVMADMQVFQNGENVVNQSVGVRTQGNSGRSQPLKRLSIFAREEYSGKDYFDPILFGKEKVHSFMTNEYVSNVALPYLVEDRDVGIQQSWREPAAVFINGEYWYTRYVMEKYNQYYLAETFDVDADNVIVFKNDEVDIGESEYEEFFRYVQTVALDTGLTADEKYEVLSQLIDMQSFIDFFSINIYLCNMNISEEENYILWRTIEPEASEYGDTKWRWLLYDLECVETLALEYYGYEERAAINSFTHPMDWSLYVMDENSVFAGLKECEAFRKQFIISFLDIANVNFAPERVEELLSRYYVDMSWKENFFLKRFDYIVEDLKEEFSLTGTLEEVVLSVNQTGAGSILLNTSELTMDEEEWSGKYYTDYPVTVTAVAKEGFRFVRWEGTYEGDEETLEAPVIPGGVRLKAVFEKIQ